MADETKNFHVERITVFFVVSHLIRDKLIGACEAFGLEMILMRQLVRHTKVS